MLGEERLAKAEADLAVARSWTMTNHPSLPFRTTEQLL